MRKVVIVGCGMVGTSYAYSLINQSVVEELVLIDQKFEYADAQAKDLQHGNVFLDKQAKIKAGNYSDCKDAEIVCITAGAAQKDGQSRMELNKVNANIIKQIVTSIMESGFEGILLIATNPVDVMTYVAQKTSKLPHGRVIGSGTALDSARFRQNLSLYFDISPKHIHARIIGEHGDSSLPLWSSATISSKSILELVEENPEKYNLADIEKCFTDAQNAAYPIIKAKGSTCYGIGISLTNITKSIISDQKSVLTLSSYLDGKYGLSDLYIPVPALVGRDGITDVLELNINQDEKKKLYKSAIEIKKAIADLNL